MQQSEKADGSSDGRRSDGNRQSPSDKSGVDKQPQGVVQDANASAEARLQILQAKQRALQEQVSQLKQELKDVPESSDGGKGRADAQKHLSKATAKMEDFQKEMAEARYRAEIKKQRAKNAVALMDSAQRELDMAKEALDGELMLSNEEKLAQKAQDMAEQLSKDADALDESVTPQERADMLDRLEAAKRLLEMMPEPQWTTVDKGGRTGAGLVLTRNPNLTPAESARQMARQFWSIAINAKKRRRQWIEDEPSDVEFFEQENEFFENAAKFDQEPMQK